MRDSAALLEAYKPLILSIYKRLHPMLNNRTDKEDLMANIKALFIKLVIEYDPRRGVDFPYYIKRMLELRVYHYVTKQLKVKNKEVIIEGLTNDEIDFSDPGELDAGDISDLINLLSWDDDFKLGKKQKNLFIGLVRDHKSLRDIADEENIDISVVHTRLHFLIKKLRVQTKEQHSREQELE